MTERSNRNKWNEHQIAHVRHSPAWQIWAAQGWELRQTAGRLVAVHEEKKKASAALSSLRTVLNWLENGKPNYYHYLKYK